MKILHVNTYDTGGAAIAIKRIHTELLKKGVQSKLLVLHKTLPYTETYSYWEGVTKPAPKNYRLLVRIFNEISKTFYSRSRQYFKKNKFVQKEERKIKLFSLISKVEVFSYPTSDFDITQHPLYKEADIIQLNWVSGFLDEPSFFKKNSKPVVWRMPDLYACGGGYHYEKDFLFDELKEEISNNYKVRQNALKETNLTLVPISRWVDAKASQSELLSRFDRYMIGNGVDLSVFKPMDKREARILFNLPLDKKIILFGAQDLNNRRKGFALLQESLCLMDMTNIVCCTFGQNLEFQNVPIINVGTIRDELLLCMLYSAADLFVMPSIEEAFGQVTIEALACGTPVVSFPTGGSLDIVENGVNGFLTKDFTAQSQVETIHKALAFPFDRELIRKNTESRLDIEKMVNEYIKLYSKIINKVNA